MDPSKIKDPILQKFIAKLDLKAYLEIEENQDEKMLTDSYLVHENKDLGGLLVKMNKKMNLFGLENYNELNIRYPKMFSSPSKKGSSL